MKWAGFKNLKAKKNKDGSFIVGGYNQDGETAAFRVDGNNVSMEATRQTNVGMTSISQKNICERKGHYLSEGNEFSDRVNAMGESICSGERKSAPEKKKTPTRSKHILQSTGSLPTNAY
ncbi:MAG TPA: hypothetical protein DD400_00095 [Rhodospirillaceae bacterium]|nr:hypothetical protein [Rhodospirillaceae bacterium]